MQNKWTFVYDQVRCPNDLQSIIAGVDKEAGDTYRDWKSRLSKSYKASIKQGGPQLARQKRPRVVRTQDDWERTCDLFESDAFRVSKMSFKEVLFYYFCHK